MDNGPTRGSGRAWNLPIEIWREILGFAIGGPQFPIDAFSKCNVTNPSEWPVLPFGWRYGLPLEDLRFGAYSSKCNVSLVCRMFYEIGREFFFEALHIRSASHALRLGETLKRSNVMKQALGRYTRNLFIIPVHDFTTAECDADIVSESLLAIFEIVCACSGLQSAVVCADNVSLFCEPTYRPWVKILTALPRTLRHIDVRNFLLSPIVWSPALFAPGASSERLVSMRFDAAHTFPALTHLSLFSWPTASKWEMPHLQALYVDYFPDSDLTRAFWARPGGWPQLRLIHFGCDTDFALYHRDLPLRLEAAAPNLEALEYHVAGDSDVLWDPTQLAASVRRIALKTFQDHTFPRFIYSAVEIRSREALQRLDASLVNLPESTKMRWDRIRRHLEKFDLHGDGGGGRGRVLVVLLPEGFVNGFGGGERLHRAGIDNNALSIADINMEAFSLWTGTSLPSRA